MTAASMPVWLKWCFWVSPLSYGQIGISVNEFLAPRWEKASLLALATTKFCLIYILMLRL